MSFDRILLVGASGHAKVVIDALRINNPSITIKLADDAERKQGQMLLGLEIKTPVDKASAKETDFHVTVGHNATREQLSDGLLAQGLTYQSILHARACVAISARIADGVFVAAQCVLGPDAQVGRGSIINHGAVVDHDCVVGAFSHIAPNATLGGNVRIGKRVLVGAGASILPGVSIGDDCVVGAGAVVLNDLPPSSVYIGVPARKFE